MNRRKSVADIADFHGEGSFYSLVRSLTEEHERELGLLITENAELRVRLGESPVSAHVRATRLTAVEEPGRVRRRTILGTAEESPSPDDDLSAAGDEDQASSGLRAASMKKNMRSGAREHEERSTLTLRSAWTSVPTTVKPPSITLKKGMTRGRSFVQPSGEVVQTPFLQRIMLPPNCNARIMWDMFSILAVAFDLVVIPLQVFTLPRTQGMAIIEWIIRIFWTLDVPASFLVGFFKEGEMVMSPYQTAKRYMMTWFLLDMLILAVDWFSVVAEPQDSGSASRLSRTVRASRIVRTIRLLRLLKLKRVLVEVQDRIDSESVCVLFKIALYLMYVLAINHFVACSWYGISLLEDVGWSSEFLELPATFSYRYTTSLHWSIAQFSMGSMDVHPKGPLERSFAIVVLLFALVVFSGLVGSITEALTQIRQLNTKQNTQMWLLRRFLKDNKVSKDLTMRIVRYCSYASEHRQQHLQEHDVDVLELLSEKLRDELNFEKHMSSLSVHKLFKTLVDDPDSSRTMHRICSSAVFMVEVIRNEVLFTVGEEAEQMFFITDGLLSYQSGDDEDLVDLHTSAVGVGEWACEVALWVQWVCVGDLFAKTECRLLSVEAKRFAEVVRSFQPQPSTWQLLRRYAKAFLEMLMRIHEEDITDLVQMQLGGGNLRNSLPGKVDDDLFVTLMGSGESIMPRAASQGSFGSKVGSRTFYSPRHTRELDDLVSSKSFVSVTSEEPSQSTGGNGSGPPSRGVTYEF